MLGPFQLLHDGPLMSMRLNGQCDHNQSPTIGLRHSRPLSVTQKMLASSLVVITICRPWVRLLGWRSRTKLAECAQMASVHLAGSAQDLQPLNGALFNHYAPLPMEISLAKTKVMVVCKFWLGHAVQRQNLTLQNFTLPKLTLQWDAVTFFNTWVCTFMCQGILFHLITPLKAKVAGTWSVVQQRHYQLQCGDIVNLELFLLQGILVPSRHNGCELCGMHSPCGSA